MKALGLCYSLFVFASLAAPPAEAHFRAFFHPSPTIGPSHGGGSRDENRGRRRDRGESDAEFAPADIGPDDAAEAPPPRYVPVPVPVPVPYYMTRWTPSHPRLILIRHGQQAQSLGVLPTVVYGDPLPEQTRRP